MKTSSVTPEDLAGSVIAVPPLCLDGAGHIDRQENLRLLSHLQSGGITTFMYGGNANFYNIDRGTLEVFLDFAESLPFPDAWIIPSAGPDFGRLTDHAALFRDSRFPTVMVLPMAAISTSAGAASGIRRFAERIVKPIVLYIKREGYIDVPHVRKLVDDGLVCGIKYAIVRDEPGADDYLTHLVSEVDRKLIVSGIGERPVIAHWRNFSLTAFTSGSCCVAPALSTEILQALRREDWAAAESLRGLFLPFEDLRDGINPIRVLHDGVRLAGIADTGPLSPMLSNLEEAQAAQVAPAAQALLAANAGLAAPVESRLA